MSISRLCSRSACRRPAVATLTYVYADQTAVVGPLATYAEPHTYDLCADHGGRLTAPRGWDIVRLAGDYSEPEPSHDDLVALADAVREAGRPRPTAEPLAPRAVARTVGSTAASSAATPPVAAPEPGGRPLGARRPARRGHLRVISDTDA